MRTKFPGIIVPAYSDPTTDASEWVRLENAASKLEHRLIVIANPHNGPGAAVRKDYVTRISKLRQLGARVIGYVHTCNGRAPGLSRQSCPRPAGAIPKDVKNWFTWYAADGIFFDQASRDTKRSHPDKTEHLTFYSELYKDVQKKQPGALVVLNFGCFPESSDYSQIGPIILCVHENEFAPPNQTATFLKWKFNPALGGISTHCAVLVYNTDGTNLHAAVTQAKANKIGWLYMTDGQRPNPWRHLPVYFDVLVNSI